MDSPEIDRIHYRELPALTILLKPLPGALSVNFYPQDGTTAVTSTCLPLHLPSDAVGGRRQQRKHVPRLGDGAESELSLPADLSLLC